MTFSGRFDGPHIGSRQYEIGQVLNFEYHAEYGSPTLFEGRARITSWNPDTEEIGFEIVDGLVGGLFVSKVKG